MTNKKRNEKAGLINFAREMGSALAMALVAIVYVIQAFKIPTGSMENSLLVGDFLLGLKFIYGAPVLPFTYMKFPGITKPKPGDVVIFKYPGSDKKDYIKRCVAGPGQTVEIKGKDLFIDDKLMKLPPNSKFVRDGNVSPMITSFKKLRIPAKGDTINFASLPIREFLFAKHLIHQEHPRKSVVAKYHIYVDSTIADEQRIIQNGYSNSTISLNDISRNIDLNKIDNWMDLQGIYNNIELPSDTQSFFFDKRLTLDGKPVTQYIVQKDNYFMMGDNRDNSMDSRFWGYVNRNFIKAKAFILYFSLDKKIPFIMLPLKIRWNRIGKLIRNWDGGINGNIIEHGTNKKYNLK